MINVHFYTCKATETTLALAATFEFLAFDLSGARTTSSSPWSRLPVSDINQRGRFYGFQTTVIKGSCVKTPAVDLNIHPSKQQIQVMKNVELKRNFWNMFGHL